MTRVTYFSEGKIAERNEDWCGFSDTVFVMADGATDNSGRMYGGKTGGELASRVIVETCLQSQLRGVELVRLLQGEIAELHEVFGVTEAIHDPKYRFTSGFIAARILNNELIVTCLGDLGFRINGTQVYQEVKQVDIDNAEKRATYIVETGDVAGSRAHVLPDLLRQFIYQNDAERELGYGVLDGTSTPAEFVKEFVFPMKDMKTLELFTDGYFAIPVGTTVEAWEERHAQVEREDPDKYLQYKSVKSKDDRTVMVVEFFCGGDFPS